MCDWIVVLFSTSIIEYDRLELGVPRTQSAISPFLSGCPHFYHFQIIPNLSLPTLLHTATAMSREPTAPSETLKARISRITRLSSVPGLADSDIELMQFPEPHRPSATPETLWSMHQRR